MATITVRLWVAIDEAGNWLARGAGTGDEFESRDEALPVGKLLAEHGVGDDDRAVEWFAVTAEVPVPQAKVLEGRLEKGIQWQTT